MDTYMETGDTDVECECPGPPPPEFRLPPPPRPPFLQEPSCSENALTDFETCDAVPVIDAEFHSKPVLPSALVIAVCSVVLLVMIFIVSIIIWKHKRKMQNFLPCKNSPRCDVNATNGVIYEDLTNIHPRTISNHFPPHHHHHSNILPSIEMTDVHQMVAGHHYAAGFPPHLIGNSSVFICPPVADYAPQVDLYNPVYEELSNGSEGSRESDEIARGGVGTSSCNNNNNNKKQNKHSNDCSEDEFAEDELSLAGPPTPPPPNTLPSRRFEIPPSGTSSLQGSTGNDLCRDIDSSDADKQETDSFLRFHNNMMSLPGGSRRQQREALPLPPNREHRSSGSSSRSSKSLDRRQQHRNNWKNSPNRTGNRSRKSSNSNIIFHEDRDRMFPPSQSSRQRTMQRSPCQETQPAYHIPYAHVIQPITTNISRQHHLHPHHHHHHEVNPYESISVLGIVENSRPTGTITTELSSFRPPPKNSSSQDSFNSDSGFSNHTSGGNTGGGGSRISRQYSDQYYDQRPPLMS